MLTTDKKKTRLSFTTTTTTAITTTTITTTTTTNHKTKQCTLKCKENGTWTPAAAVLAKHPFPGSDDGNI